MTSDLVRQTRKLEALARGANAEHVRARGAVSAALAHARKAGSYLLEARGLIPYGEWMRWLKAKCTFSDRTARAYVQVALRYDELSELAETANLDSSSDGLTLEKALYVLSGPDDPPAFLPPPAPDVIAELEALPDTQSRIAASLADGEDHRRENRARDRAEQLEDLRRRLGRLEVLFASLGLGWRARRWLRALRRLTEE